MTRPDPRDRHTTYLLGQTGVGQPSRRESVGEVTGGHIKAAFSHLPVHR